MKLKITCFVLISFSIAINNEEMTIKTASRFIAPQITNAIYSLFVHTRTHIHTHQMRGQQQRQV